MTLRSLLLIVLMPALISACATPSTHAVDERPARGAIGDHNTPSPGDPLQGSTAARDLAEEAEILRAQGKLDAAAAKLERALRIARDSAQLWQRLAQIRLQQGLYKQAESMAQKSNQLTASDPLRSLNWRLIAQARQQAGDTQGYESAMQRAHALQGR